MPGLRVAGNFHEGEKKPKQTEAENPLSVHQFVLLKPTKLEENPDPSCWVKLPYCIYTLQTSLAHSWLISCNCNRKKKQSEINRNANTHTDFRDITRMSFHFFWTSVSSRPGRGRRTNRLSSVLRCQGWLVLIRRHVCLKCVCVGLCVRVCL